MFKSLFKAILSTSSAEQKNGLGQTTIRYASFYHHEKASTAAGHSTTKLTGQDDTGFSLVVDFYWFIKRMTILIGCI